mmetsp:Transcript_5590/g.12565  ORF Transcript_5590/g.12565 Transcript_5590/m.12565 type:complete len:80 (+) Transcript_5590:526-765(+)
MMTSEEAPTSASIDAVMTDPPMKTRTNNTSHNEHEQHEQKHHAEALTLTQRTHNKYHDNDEKDWGETSMKCAATRSSSW